MPTPLAPAPVDIRQLHYSAGTRTFISEMSEINGFGRVWADSADEGFTIVGATGRRVVFVVADEHRDSEGDVTHWTLRSVDGAFSATIFND